MAVAQAQPDAARRADLEQRFLSLLQTGVSKAAQRYICRQLGMVASDRAVPAMAPLLDDPELAHMARFVLEQIPGSAPDQLLLEKMGSAPAREKIGIIGSLGKRRASQATGALAALLEDRAPEIAAAAAGALGNIGDPNAARALMQFRPPGSLPLSLAVEDALLRAAERLAATAAQSQAREIYQALCSQAKRRLIRMAGLRGLLAVEPDKALTRLLEALRSPDREDQVLAARMVVELPARQDCAAIVKVLPEQPAATQIVLLGALAERQELSAKPVITRIAQTSGDLEVRRAAWEALAALCDASDIRFLAQAAAAGDEPTRSMARASLFKLSGQDVDAAMVASLEGASPEVRVELIQTLVARSVTKAKASLRGCLGDSAEMVRLAAAKGFGALGTEEDAPALIAYFQSARTADEAAVAERALSAVCARNPLPCAPLILTAMKQTQGDPRLAMLRMLSSLGGTEALDMVRNEMNAADPALRDAALRALAAWPEAEAMPDLLRIVKSEAALNHRVVAFQGYVRLLRTTPQPEGKIQSLTAAMDAAPRMEDKKLVLAALAESPGPESLKLAAVCLSDPGLVEEAAITVVSIAKAKGLNKAAYPAAAAALSKVLEVTQNPATRQQAQEALRKLESSK
jgi:HEAT repeat protein